MQWLALAALCLFFIYSIQDGKWLGKLFDKLFSHHRTPVVVLVSSLCLFIVLLFEYREAGRHLSSYNVSVSGYYRDGYYVEPYSRRSPGGVSHDYPFEKKQSQLVLAMAGLLFIAFTVFYCSPLDYWRSQFGIKRGRRKEKIQRRINDLRPYDAVQADRLEKVISRSTPKEQDKLLNSIHDNLTKKHEQTMRVADLKSVTYKFDNGISYIGLMPGGSLDLEVRHADHKNLNVYINSNPAKLESVTYNFTIGTVLYSPVPGIGKKFYYIATTKENKIIKKGTCDCVPMEIEVITLLPNSR